MTTMQPPPGFQPHNRKSPVTDPWEPIFVATHKHQVKLGFWIGENHCNSRGFLHGGVIAAIADNAMGLSCAKLIRDSGEPLSGLVTTNLAIDYSGAAKLRQWFEIDTDIAKIGRRLCFARALAKADSEVVALCSATFKRSS